MRLETPAGRLDLKGETISIEISNPYFDFDSIPGTTTYAFTLPLTDNNQRLLNFPLLRVRGGEIPAPEMAYFYIDGALWRAGSLVYESGDEAKRELRYTFVADAADLASRIEGLTLPGLELGSVPLVLSPTAADYALPSFRNSAFYGDKREGWKGVLNRYQNGQYSGTIVPFPRLIPLLRRVLAALGYQVSGPWLDETEAQQLVVYSDRAAEEVNGNRTADVVLNRHVPTIEIGAFLVNLKKFCGLGFRFHPVRQQVMITSLADIIADQRYIDRTGGPATVAPPDTGGYALEMELESDDELNKTLDTGWAKLRLGAGKNELSTSAGTLHVVREKDPLDEGRQWLVPAVEAKGASEAYELGNESRCGLRLLFDRGLRPDSRGSLYPLATWDWLDYQGNMVGVETLHWEGLEGLYERRYRDWLAFLAQASRVERTMQFRVADLLTLDPGRKEMVEGRKYLWEKISFTVSSARRLETAKFTYRHCRL